MKAKHLFYLSVMLVLAVAAGAGAISVLTVRETVITLAFEGGPPADDVIERTAQVLRERIDAFGGEHGVRSGTVEYDAPNLVVRLRGRRPLGSFADELVRGNAIRLHLAADQHAQEEFERTGAVPSGYKACTLVHERLRLGSWGETHKTDEQLLLRSEPEMVISRVERVRLTTEGWSRTPVITIQFSPQQGEQFASLAQKHSGRRLAVAVEDEIFTAPKISGSVSGGVVQIRNIVYYPRAERLYKLLKSGALPAPLKVMDIAPPESPQESGPPVRHAAAR